MKPRVNWHLPPSLKQPVVVPRPVPRKGIVGRVLGIDPGYANVGWGVVDVAPDGALTHVAHGAICTTDAQPLHARVDTVVDALRRLVVDYKPTAISAEAWIFYESQKGHEGTGFNTMRVCGAVRAIARCLGVPCYEYDAQTLKGVVAQDRCAEKLTVQKAVQKLLGLGSMPRPNHAADALAAAVTAARLGPPALVPPAPESSFARPARKPRRRTPRRAA